MWFAPKPRHITIEGEGVLLRTPQADDFVQWSRLREASREFLTPWEPVWPRDDLTRGGFRRRLRRYAQDIEADQAYPFLIFREGDHALLGGITLSNVRRGIVQAGMLGYWIGAPFAGQGHMRAAIRAVLPFLFARLSLHRVEAACLPDNIASIRLLEGAGFQREGLARQYLCINGEWQDHLLFGRLAGDAALQPRIMRQA